MIVSKYEIERAEASGVARGLTMVEVGARLGISRGMVWYLERSAIEKIRREIVKEARGAGVSVREWLF